ncbi:MAG TPA: methyltransferase domain-containing protein [Ktedonobacterales bacterium]|nr:methyltransferase domain-containing protein [Ktedonobacterales bacterium]
MAEDEDLRESYDRIAQRYADEFYDELGHKPFDRDLLDRFAALVGPGASTLDVGCGPGHVGRYLSDRGVAVAGLDLSPGMVECAARLNPGMIFSQGSMLALPFPDANFAAIVAFYSIIHLARADAILALVEFHRALRPGGWLLLAFHGGQGEVHREEWYGERVRVHATFFTLDEMATYLRAAGFTVAEQHERLPYEGEYQSQRMYALARKRWAGE